MPTTINGTGLAEKIIGSIGDDVIDGGAGNDSIYGGNGNDLIYGGDGNDTMSGEAGNDTVNGGAGNDVLYGGGGNDILNGDDGDDGLVGDGGDDVLYGARGSNVLWGGTGNDKFIHVVGEGVDNIQGQAGTDTLELRLSASQINSDIRGELATLKAFMAGELSSAGSTAALAGQATGAALNLSALGVTLSTIEAVKIVVDGVEVTIDSLLNHAPTTAAAVAATMLEDGTLAGLVAASDADGDVLGYSLGKGPLHGALTLDAKTGDYVYTPAANWSGTDTFKVVVTDAMGATTTQDVTVSVGAVADAPTLEVGSGGAPSLLLAKTSFTTSTSSVNVITGTGGNDVIVVPGAKATSIALDVASALTDTDGSETLSITIGHLPPGGVLSAGHDNGDGTWTLTPDDLAGLQLTAILEGDVDLAITAKSTDIDGSTASTDATLHIAASVAGNVINGGQGNDHITSGAGDDIISGGKGNDTIMGGAGDDRIDGNSGDDAIFDGAGNDKVYGSSGNDVVHAGEGNDYFNGGSGFDTLDFSGAKSGMTIDISKSVATGMGADTFSGFEKYVGSALADDIKGSSRGEIIDGGAGDDVIRGLGGADTLTGGQGKDTFVWFAKDLGNGNNALDHVTDFGAGDRLDLHDMLRKFAPGDAANHLRLTDGPSGSTLSVEISHKYVDVAVLEGVHHTSAADLLAMGAILV